MGRDPRGVCSTRSAPRPHRCRRRRAMAPPSQARSSTRCSRSPPRGRANGRRRRETQDRHAPTTGVVAQKRVGGASVAVTDDQHVCRRDVPCQGECLLEAELAMRRVAARGIELTPLNTGGGRRPVANPPTTRRGTRSPGALRGGRAALGRSPVPPPPAPPSTGARPRCRREAESSTAMRRCRRSPRR